jgi:phenylacetate-CoA ligase
MMIRRLPAFAGQERIFSVGRKHLLFPIIGLREWIYFVLMRLRGQDLRTFYSRILRESRGGIPPATSKDALVRLFLFCKTNVPYYASIMKRTGDSFFQDPEEYLRRFPILTKRILRERFDELKPADLAERHWFLNTSGGSTGEPVRFVQDWEFTTKAAAISFLFSRLAGRRIGELAVHLWGSTRDLLGNAMGWKARVVNKITNDIFLNAFQMTPAKMRQYIAFLNSKHPQLIIAYADSLYELARFAQSRRLEVVPQKAVITSAGMLHPFMREKIEEVFHCRVIDRYGSREVGDIACELPGGRGLWVAPWGNYLEIVDDRGNPLPDGQEGQILVTSLSNFAMPLIRYSIGDRGILSRRNGQIADPYGQILEKVTGRSADIFRKSDGTIIHAGYFMVILFFKDWINQYQVVQKNFNHVLFRIVKSGQNHHQSDLDEIAAKTRLAMGKDCMVEFEFLEEIPPSPSGKYRYTISEVQPSQG